MFLIIHILLATFSIIFAFFTAMSPSRSKLATNYLLIFGTVLSGGVVAFESPQHLGRVCIEGLFYLGIIVAMLIASKKIHTDELCIKKSDGSEVCINGDQFNNFAPSPTPTPAETITPSIAPTELDASPTSASDIIN